ncbi:MAG: hypothetical protein AAFP90_17485, partial [Planctomycetota bacterium]
MGYGSKESKGKSDPNIDEGFRFLNESLDQFGAEEVQTLSKARGCFKRALGWFGRKPEALFGYGRVALALAENAEVDGDTSRTLRFAKDGMNHINRLRGEDPHNAQLLSVAVELAMVTGRALSHPEQKRKLFYAAAQAAEDGAMDPGASRRMRGHLLHSGGLAHCNVGLTHEGNAGFEAYSAGREL